MTQTDLITPARFLAQLHASRGRLPRMLKGLYYAAISDREKTLSLASLLEDVTRKYPHSPALLDETRSLSYRQFNAWANRYAHALKAEGVQHGSVVAVMLENRLEQLALLAGLAKLGAVSALINTTQRGKVLTHSLNLVSPSFFVVGEELFEAFVEVRKDVPGAGQGCYWLADRDTRHNIGKAPQGWINLAGLLAGQSDADLPDSRRVKLKDACFYIYTSGTTGLPKAAVISHNKWVKAYAGFGLSGLGLGNDDVLYMTLPLYHSSGAVVSWSCALAGGAAMAVRRKFSASAFWKDVARYRATSFSYIGELCRYLLNQPESREEKNNTLTSMIGNGLRPSIWGAFKERFDVQRIVEFYGASEGNIAFINLLNFDNTVGLCPAPYAVVRYDLENERPLRDAKGFLQKVETGESGLLIGEISEKYPFDGYTEAGKSESMILHDVFCKGDAWVNTGDLMRDLGCKHAQFVDRLGDTFRWKGENVATNEIESLLGDYPGIEDAVVYGVEIPGTNGRCGMAALRLGEGVQLDLKGLASYLQQSMPAYAVPLFIRLLGSVDVTGTFKYKKSDLKQQAYDPNAVADILLVQLPGSDSFQPLTRAIFDKIQKGAYRF
jgi:citronellyl-CoA synthetase